MNYSTFASQGLGHKDYQNRWQKAGDEYKTNIPSMGGYVNSDARDRFYAGSSATVAKGDHVRLQDISLSLDLDPNKMKNIPLKQMQLYIYVSNLGLIWKANNFGLDPDVLPGSTDRLLFPSPMSFSFGIKAGF